MDKRAYQAEWTRHYEGTSVCSLVADAANDRGPVPDLLPPCFRLTSIERLPAVRGCLNRATLFHEQAAMTVEWTSRQPDVNLNRGCLVDIRWSGRPQSVDGTFRIARLVRLDRPKPAVNLFATIPSSWVKDRDLVRRARALMAGLPRGFQHLFNGIFWDGKRFERFVTGPSSLKGHHHGRNGNFWHSVDVAEQALASGNRYGTTYPPLLILGGLLHDAGKADEYELDTAQGRFVLTARGKLVGHKQTVIEWIAAARAEHRVVIADAYYLTLIHMLTAMRGVPDWTGIRKLSAPVSKRMA